MKKVCRVTLGTMMVLGFVAPVYADLENSFFINSAISVTGTYTDTSNNTLSMGDYRFFDINLDWRRAAFIDTDPEFDYAIGYTYHIPCTETRFFLSYDHFDTDDDNLATGFVTNIEISPSSFDPSQATSAYGRVQQYAEEFRVGFSRYITFSPRYVLDVNAFFEWDKVTRNLTERAKFLSDPHTFVVRETEDEVEGWGPGVGATAFIKPFCNLHWGFFMGFKTSLIWADNHFSEILQSSEQLNSDYLLDPEESDSLVTKLDISFGIDYCSVFHTDFGGMLFAMDLGMRYMNMFNVFKNGNAAYNSLFRNFTSFPPNAANTGYAYDWGRIGPYLTFRIGGAEA